MLENYFDMTQNEVKDFLYQHVPEGAAVLEMGPNAKRSSKVFKEMLDKKYIVAYRGGDIRKEPIRGIEQIGLKGFYIEDPDNFDISIPLTEMKENPDTVVVLAMPGLSEVAPVPAAVYRKAAKKVEATVVE